MTLQPVQRPAGRPTRLSLLFKTFTQNTDANSGEKQNDRASDRYGAGSRVPMRRAASIPPTRIKPVIIAVSQHRKSSFVVGPPSPAKVAVTNTAPSSESSTIRRRSTGRAHRLSILMSGLNLNTTPQNNASGSGSIRRNSITGGSMYLRDPAAAAAFVAQQHQQQHTETPQPANIPSPVSGVQPTTDQHTPQLHPVPPRLRPRQRRLSDSYTIQNDGHGTRASFANYLLGMFYSKKLENNGAGGDGGSIMERGTHPPVDSIPRAGGDSPAHTTTRGPGLPPLHPLRNPSQPSSRNPSILTTSETHVQSAVINAVTVDTNTTQITPAATNP